MKQINEYRRTKHFNICGTVLSYMVEVDKFVRGLRSDSHLVVIVPAEEGQADDRIDLFAVRVLFGNHTIYDLLIEASTHKPCQMIDRVLISGNPVLA